MEYVEPDSKETKEMLLELFIRQSFKRIERKVLS